ncbi:hypothetical protein [Mycobacterium intracellulare]|uniref:hypothetical protein n=1 Tax=Mycobacterium intracellulare TaxID=1767 RepID=UPI00080B706B|nr:hypothetical protein [Mycobacterium intracellulare]OCB22481.1 hypothetical protein A5689_17740 [Mycobacterium intracellulare subsp. yongonense]
MRLTIDNQTEQTTDQETAADDGIGEVADAIPDTDTADADDGAGVEPDASTEGKAEASAPAKRSWKRWLTMMAFPVLTTTLTVAIAILKWQDGSAKDAQIAAAETVKVASDSTVAMLAYQPGTVDKQLSDASNRLTGGFRDDYMKLVHDVVIPGSKKKHVAATATVPAASSISATADHAQVLVFVNQTTTIGDGIPTNSISSVKITLDKVDGRWLVSGFEPV